MNITYENLQSNQVICSAKVQKLVEGDVIVPDIKPDILKLLQTDAVSVIKDKHISDGCFDIDGKIDLTMLYIPDAENEQIKSINATFDFNESILNKQLCETDSVVADTYIERIDVSLVNSRKLKIKAVICIQYEVIKNVALSLAVDVEDCENAQIKRETISVQNCLDILESKFSIHEKIEVSSGQDSIGELLKYDIKISDFEHKAMNEKIVVKGVLCVCILYVGNSGKIEFYEGEIPFTEIFEMENLSEDSCCDLELIRGDFFVNTEEDSDGDMRIIDIEGNVNVCIKAADDIEVDVIEDCYEPYKTTNIERKTVTIDEIVARPQSQNTIRDIIEVNSSMPPVTGVYDVITRVGAVNAEISGDRVACEGKIEAFVLYISDSEENPIYSIKKEIPFSYMLDGVSGHENLTPKVKAQIKHTGYSLNAAGEIEIRIVIALNVNIVNQRASQIICGISEAENKENLSNGIIIYFVQSGDTLWDVAKKYCVPSQDIVSFNNMNDDKLKEGARILIPGK